jgi:hypothetical protein
MINEARSYGARLRHALAALIGVGIILVGVIGMPHAAPAAHADDSPGLTATPTTIAVGGIARVSATGLGGLETAEFGLDSTPGGKFVESSSSTYSAPVTAGTATATFTADQPGTFTIAVGDGESVLATATVTVTAANPTAPPTVTAHPDAVVAEQSTTITATGLGGLASAVFGLDSTPGGSFTGGVTTITVPVTNGIATTTFTADRAGTFTIAVGDGETPLATTTVTVSVPAPAPTPTTTPTLTPTPSPSPTPPAGGGQSAWIWALVALAVVLVAGAAITAVVITRRRARSSEQSTPDAAP